MLVDPNNRRKKMSAGACGKKYVQAKERNGAKQAHHRRFSRCSLRLRQRQAPPPTRSRLTPHPPTQSTLMCHPSTHVMASFEG